MSLKKVFLFNDYKEKVPNSGFMNASIHYKSGHSPNSHNANVKMMIHDFNTVSMCDFSVNFFTSSSKLSFVFQFNAPEMIVERAVSDGSINSCDKSSY